MNTDHNMARRVDHGALLVLGLVILPRPGSLAQAIAALTDRADINLGPRDKHRLPAVAETRIGQDDELLREVRALPGVMHVDIVFAQVVAEESL